MATIRQQSLMKTNIANTLQQNTNVAAQSLSNAAQQHRYQMGTLAQRLSSFGEQQFQRAATISKKEAEERAFIDINNGIYDNENPDTIYGMAYSDMAQQAYSAKIATEAKSMAQALKAKYAMNPDDFDKAYNKYATTVLETSPNEVLRAVGARKFLQYGGEAYAELYGEKEKRLYNNSKASFEGYQDVLKDEYKTYMTQGNVEKANDVLDNLRQLQSSAVLSGFTSAGQVEFFNREMVADGYEAQTMANFGNTFEEYKDFASSEHPLIDLERKEKIQNKMLNNMKALDDFRQRAKKEAEEREEKIKTQTSKTLDLKVIAGQASQQELDEQYENNKLDRVEYERLTKKLQEGGLIASNGNQKILVERNLLNISEEEIMGLDLTNADKIKYLSERKKAIESASNKWASTVEGREAFRRINAKFNIIEGQTIVQMAGSSGVILQEYDETLRSFHKKVMELPLEERFGPQITFLADEAIQEIDQKKEERARLKKEERERLKKEEEERVKNEEKNSIWYKFKESTNNFASEMFETGVQ